MRNPSTPRGPQGRPEHGRGATGSGSPRTQSRGEWAEHVRPRLSSLRLSPSRENEIVEELAQHLEDRWCELVAGGAGEDEATRLALAEFREGNLLAKYMAPLQQARTPAPITLGRQLDTCCAMSGRTSVMRPAW
jgi:hypothetical protein